MSNEDIKSVFDEAIKNCYENGFGGDLEDMTSDELTAELLDGNDCFEEEDREALREIVRAWQEERAGFNVGNRTGEIGFYNRAREPQACLFKTAKDAVTGSCPVCRAIPGEPCRQSEQDKEREQEWNERRRGTGLNVGIIR